MELAQASLARCRAVPEFFPTFYELLLASTPEIPPLFAHTKFARQHKLLEHGLGLLLIYAKRPNPSLLERIAVRHARADLNVPAHLYPHFVVSLLAAVRRHDPQCGADVEEAWRTALKPGIEYMKSRY
ncbi:MAG TPA: hypothetical protein VJ992_13370 [Gemmatimonadales bacterium]|nr:hypothetical protein [Gemmatimonadales bacterium]